MYRRYAVTFNKKQVEFVNCLNIIEKLKKARAHPSGLSHLGVKCYTVSSSGGNKKGFVTLKDNN